jgi:positive regulator of sigma E activity
MVSVEFDPARAIQAAMILFLVPVLALLAGVFLGHKMGESQDIKQAENFAVAGGFIFLTICVLVIAILDRKQRRKSKKGPKIVAILPGDACPGAPR